jgi:hypothetical protein
MKYTIMKIEKLKMPYMYPYRYMVKMEDGTEIFSNAESPASWDTLEEIEADILKYYRKHLGFSIKEGQTFTIKEIATSSTTKGEST